MVGGRWRRAGALAVGGVGVPAKCFEKGCRLFGTFEYSCDAQEPRADRANEGIDLPDLEDEFAPLLARDARHGVAGQLDNFDCIAFIINGRREGIGVRLYGPPLIEHLGVQFMGLFFPLSSEVGIGPASGQRRVSGAGS